MVTVVTVVTGSVAGLVAAATAGVAMAVAERVMVVMGMVRVVRVAMRVVPRAGAAPVVAESRTVAEAKGEEVMGQRKQPKR